MPLSQGKLDILNTDQSVQLTALDLTSRLEEADIRISMDSRCRTLDNVFVERLWRTSSTSTPTYTGLYIGSRVGKGLTRVLYVLQPRASASETVVPDSRKGTLCINACCWLLT